VKTGPPHEPATKILLAALVPLLVIAGVVALLLLTA
jgi:hypothetical protein